MGSHSAVPNASPDMALQPTALATLSFPQPSESLKSLTPKAVPNISPSQLKSDQDAVAEPFPEGARLPTGSADWEAKKEIIREHYMEKNMILNEVMEIMLTKHKFKATARMYKGQFAKWKWTKYNKSSNSSLTKPTKSRAAKRHKTVATMNQIVDVRKPEANMVQQQHAQFPLVSQQIHLLYFGDEDCQVESTLTSYAALISHWSEQETPWKTTYADPNRGQVFEPQKTSILQLVRAAQGCFMTGNSQLGGHTLRQAFLGIESAVENGLSIEALWDCCLAVPQLVMTMGWTDMLCIFAKFLYELTSIKLAGHPINKIAESLYKLSRQGLANWQLEMYVTRGWCVWIDCLSRVRGRQDDVTIHLKRGYVTLINSHHKMARDIICDFGKAVQNSLSKRGAPATTSRILELEHLLVRMFVPLFTPESATRAQAMLKNVANRIEEKPQNKRLPVTEWDYMDRYLVFSANYFLASISDYNNESHLAAEYRKRSLDSPRDLFWLQTSLLLEQRMRSEGNDIEANALMNERTKVQLELEGCPTELQFIG